MKIGVISDLHLGHRQYGSMDREQDFYDQFHKCIDKINELDCEIVIIAGDIFHTANPSPKAIHEYEDGIGDLRASAVVAIQGNHTMLLRDNHYSIDKFFEDCGIEGYTLLDDDTWTLHSFALASPYDGDMAFLKEKDVYIDGVTYRGNSQIDEFMEKVNLLASAKHQEGACRILVVHQAFKEFCGFTGEELSINDINFSPYDFIICGHIHSPLHYVLDDNTVFFQPGSIERLNTTEARDEIEHGKGVWIIDTDTLDFDFYPIESDRKFLMGKMDIHSKDDMTKHIDELIEEIKKLDKAPAIAYEYHDYIDNPEFLRDEMSRLSKESTILLNNSNIYEEVTEEVSVEITDGEIPTVAQAILNSNAGLSDDEKQLAIDIHESFKHSDDVDSLLEDYRIKHFNHEVETKSYRIEDDEELMEIIEYFENL